MAYVSRELKAKIAPVVKEICNRFGVKGTLSIRNHSTLVLTISSGSIDFIGNYRKVGAERYDGEGFAGDIDNMSVNPYWYHVHFDGKALDFLTEVIKALNTDNYDNSDVQSDYFDCGHYLDVKIGKWDKPYILTAK